jgi:hypothetical protein
MKSRADLEKIFDELYDRVDSLIKRHNPCQVTVTPNTRFVSGVDVRCTSNRESTIKCGIFDKGKRRSLDLCCGGCEFHTPTGCVAEKPMACRMWLCYTIKNNPKNADLVNQLNNLESEARREDFYVIRGDKKMIIDRAMHLLGCRERLDNR